MKIRKAKLSDAYEIARVHVLSGKTAFSNVLPDYIINDETFEEAKKDIETKIKEALSGKACLFVSEEKSKITGYAQGGNSLANHGPSEEYPAELYNIFVLDEFQNKGIGSKLFLEVVKWFISKDEKALMLCVFENTQAENYYRKLGGTKVFERKEGVIDRTVKLITYGWKDIHLLEKKLKG